MSGFGTPRRTPLEEFGHVHRNFLFCLPRPDDGGLFELDVCRCGAWLETRPGSVNEHDEAWINDNLLAALRA